MPKYYDFKVSGYYLYFTSFCVIECMHAHASDRKLTEAGTAKLFVKEDGETVIAEKGLLTDRDLRKIRLFIKENYKEMYILWKRYSQEGFCFTRLDSGYCPILIVIVTSPLPSNSAISCADLSVICPSLV